MEKPDTSLAALTFEPDQWDALSPRPTPGEEWEYGGTVGEVVRVRFVIFPYACVEVKRENLRLAPPPSAWILCARCGQHHAEHLGCPFGHEYASA